MTVGIADAQGEQWRQVKRITANPFSMVKLKKQIPMFNDVFVNMLAFVEKEADTNSAVDASNVIKLLALDMLGYVGLGIEVNSFKNPECEFRQHANNLVETWRFLGIELAIPLFCFFKIGAWNPKSEKFFEMIGKQAIAARTRGNVEGKDVLGSLVKANREEPNVMTDEMVKFIILNMVVDMYVTVSDVMTNLVYCLAVNPEVQAKAQSEIDAVFDEKENGN